MREEKRSEIIQDALNFLDDEMIEDVEKLRGFVEKEKFEQGSSVENGVISIENALNKSNKKRNWHKWIVLAASVCVFITGTWLYENYVKPANDLREQSETKPENKQEENLPQENSIEESDSVSSTSLYEMQSGNGVNAESLKSGITIPAMEVNLAKEDGTESDMIGFFIHQGRCYVEYNYVKRAAGFVGECVGTVNGLIDEWTEEDGYVDGAGTFEGKIYEVEGISPEFMLCTIWDNGMVETFIHNNGIMLTKGSELLDDRLHLRDMFTSVAFQTDYEYSYTQNEPIALSDEHLALFTEFLDSFAENDFAYVEGKSFYPFGGEEDNSHIYHLYFTTENGLVLRFSLVGDGYVCFPWLNGVCVQIDQEIYDEVVDVLNENLN